MGKRFDSYRRALEASNIMGVLADEGHVRNDANETAAFARQLEDIDTTLYRVQYPENKGTLLVPVKSDINPGAEEYTYTAMDYAGQAKRTTNYATDASRVDVQGRQITSKIASYTDAYGYSIQDLRRAAMTKIAIENERAMAAREVVARKIDEVIWLGDSDAGIVGFAKSSDVSLVTVITGAWDSATADEILADLLKLERAAFVDSKGVEIPDTIVLPPSKFALLVQPLGDNKDKTILDYFLAKSMFVKNVDWSFRLETADAENDGPRAICYKRDPAKVQCLLPIEFEQFPPEARNLAFLINCHARCGGTIFRYPGSARYMDGI